MVEFCSIRMGAVSAPAEFEVPSDRQMLQQAGILKHETDLSFVRWQATALVLPGFLPDAHVSPAGHQPCHSTQQGGFARSGSPVNGCDTATGCSEADIQMKLTTFQLQGDV